MEIAQVNQIVLGMGIDPGVENRHIGNLYTADRDMVMDIIHTTAIIIITMADIILTMDGTGQLVLWPLVQLQV